MKRMSNAESTVANEAASIEAPPSNVQIDEVLQVLERLAAIEDNEKERIEKAVFQACEACCDVEISGEDVSVKENAKCLRESLVQAMYIMNMAQMRHGDFSQAYLKRHDITQHAFRVLLVEAWAQQYARDTKKQKLNE